MNSIKHKIKRLIKQQLSKDALMNIDFVCKHNGTVLLCGWYAHKTQAIDSKLKVYNGQSTQEMSVFQFPRSDVQRHLNLQSSDQVSGFIAVVLNASNVDDIVLEHAGDNFPVAKQRFSLVTNPNQIVMHAGDELPNAQKFVESYVDVDWSKKTASKVVKKVDPDVQKIQSILANVNVHEPDFYEQCQADIIPAIQKVWKTRQSKNNAVELIEFGRANEVSKVSIIIPLYGRYDFMQHQLSHFSVDEDFEHAEIIFVLDDPSLMHEVKVTAHGLFQTFKHPFKLVVSEHNLGFAGANNLGVNYASADKLLLLNSDIIPKTKGWLSSYLAQFEHLENPGVLGATLVYEDETIQHAGMEMVQDSSYPGIYMNHHPYKGVPLGLTKRASVSKTNTTTGACMLMHKSNFEQVGGFDPMYVLGDFEDSDLCLKLIDKGLTNYVSSDIVLYHLERLSQNLVDAGDWKFKLTLVNGAYQMTKWKSLIEEVSA